MIALLLAAALAIAPQFTSEFTSLSDCKVTAKPGKPNSDGPNDFSQLRCPGREGFTVYSEAGDIYGWLRLQKGKTEIKLWGVGMDELIGPVVKGTKLEWRYQTTTTDKKLAALIYRITGNDRKAYDSGDMNKMSEYLYVIKLKDDGFCILGHAPTNDAAHQIADSGKPCPSN